MPRPLTAKLPLPKSPDEFEDICLDVIRRRWADLNANRLGRSGQAQHGVDILGSSGSVRGAQCKNKSQLSLNEVVVEIKKADSFSPPLSEYFILVGGRRDAKLQAEVARLSCERQAIEKFPIHLMFEEDLIGEIASNPDLLQKWWPEWGRPDEGAEGRPLTAGEFRQFAFGKNDFFGPYYDPHLQILVPGDENRRIEPPEWFRLRLFSESFSRSDFEPHEEEHFGELVKRVFETGDLEPVRGNATCTKVEYRGPQRDNHQLWAWDTRGCIGFATTIRSLFVPGRYSVPDLTLMYAHLLELAAALEPTDNVLAVLELRAGELLPYWSSDDQRTFAVAGGIQGEAFPCSQHHQLARVVREFSPRSLPEDSMALASGFMIKALRDLHNVLVSTSEFADSIINFRETLSRVRDL